MTQPGWYPSGGGMRWYDGQQWTPHFTPAQPHGQTVVVTGPNHVLHGLLSLFTWPFLGGWLWVWLVVSLVDKRKTQIRQY
jgi:hypothetical protein